MAISEDLS